MAATGNNDRLALLDEIEGLERMLESDASWVAWRALDRGLARGAGPAPEEAGTEIGRCIVQLCQNTHYIALLAAQERLRGLAAATPTEVPRTKGRRRPRATPADETATPKVAPPVGEAPPGFLAAVGPPPPFTPTRPADPALVADPPQPAPLPPMPQSSLLERIARLEKEAVALKPIAEAMALQPPPPRPMPLVVEEAELTIVVPEDGDDAAEPAPARGLLARLERIADSLASKPPAAKAPTLQAEEAEVEIVTDDDDDSDPRPSVAPRARSSHER